MTDDQINRAIAEDRGWKVNPYGGLYPPNLHPLSNLATKYEQPNYLDEKNPRPAHELIEVLRGEGWLWSSGHIDPADKLFKEGETWYYCDFSRPDGTDGVDTYAPTFCHAVAEAYLRVRGKWQEEKETT